MTLGARNYITYKKWRLFDSSIENRSMGAVLAAGMARSEKWGNVPPSTFLFPREQLVENASAVSVLEVKRAHRGMVCATSHDTSAIGGTSLLRERGLVQRREQAGQSEHARQSEPKAS